MWIEEVNPDPDRDLEALMEELERYGGTLIWTNEPSAAYSPEVVRLVLPDDEYRAKQCRETLRQWHNAQG